MKLRDSVLPILREPIDSIAGDTAFDTCARAIFNYQFNRNQPYQAYCIRRGKTPGAVKHWTDIPPVPTAAYKEVALVAGDVRDAEAIFRTSGTTQGSEKRGTHYVLDLSLYHASLLPSFAARMIPDNASMPMLSILPRAAEMPSSSLAHMVAVAMEHFGGDESGYYATVERGIDEAPLEAALTRFVERNIPVCILGTSFSFVHWIDSMRERGVHFALPTGSRLMDTGGYKGKSREVPADEMLTSYEQLLGIPSYACINEYGMTELCSQMYDVTLSDQVRHGAPGTRRKRPPPWMRVRIVDPVTLQPTTTGERGLVQLFDLANIGSVLAVQTEDVGAQVEDGYVLFGRMPGAQPRGCSIAMDDMLQAVRSPRI